MTATNENPEAQETQDIPAASAAPNSTEEFFPDTDSGTDGDETAREQAWQQQQQASQTYFDETQTFGYPNSAAPAAPAPKTVYKRGHNMAAIIWGVITLIVAASLIAWFLLPGLFVTTNMWAVLFSAAFAAIGLSLVVGAVITSLTGRRSKDETTPPVL